MHILHIIDTLNIGGAEKLLVDFIRGFKKLYPDDRHFLVTLKNDAQLLLPEVEHATSGYTCLNFSFKNLLQSTKKLKGFIKINDVQVVHTHLFYSTIIARIALGRQHAIKLVTTYHNMEYSKESPSYSWKLPLIDRYTLWGRNRHAIFVSESVLKAVTKEVPGITNYTLLPNFVPSTFNNRYVFDETDFLKLVTVGNLKPVKNHIFALIEIKKLHHRRVSLDIYGEGPLREELQAYISKTGIPVRLMGSALIDSDLLSQYDAFLMTSTSEGMPISLIEAIATGLPSLLTDLPQLRETAGPSGLYFKLHPGCLHQLLEYLLANKHQLKSLAEAAINWKEKFQLDNYLKVVRQVYVSKS